MRKIPLKNYFWLALVVIITVALVFYIVEWYHTTKKYQLHHSILEDTLSEIKESEFHDYLIDNSSAIIYLFGTKEMYPSFEKELRDYIIHHNYQKDIVYLNLNFVTTGFMDMLENAMSDELKDKKVTLGMIPNIIVWEDGKIVNILYPYHVEPRIQDVEKFLGGIIHD